MNRKKSRSSSKPSLSHRSREGGPGGGRLQRGRKFSPPFSRKEKSREEELQKLHFNKKDRWVVGIHSVEEVLKVRSHAVKRAYIKKGAEKGEQFRAILQLMGKNHVSSHEVFEEQLDDLSQSHQGVAVSVSETPQVDWSDLETSEEALVLFLDGIEDPHNLGAILRTAWLMGVKAVFIPKDRSVGLVPTACKVASGGAEHVPIEESTAFTNELNRLKEYGFWVYGLAEKGASSVYESSLHKKCVWVIGAEDKGLRIATERACDLLLRLPQVHTGSSYNASVAAALALGETHRQLKFSPG